MSLVFRSLFNAILRQTKQSDFILPRNYVNGIHENNRFTNLQKCILFVFSLENHQIRNPQFIKYEHSTYAW